MKIAITWRLFLYISYMHFNVFGRAGQLIKIWRARHQTPIHVVKLIQSWPCIAATFGM